jgi:hypothetical protein
LVYLIGILGGEFDVLDVNNKDFDCFNVFSNFLVNAESFFEKLVLFLLGDISELETVIVVKSVDVVHHTTSF